ncbi:hypothetical protein FRB90_000795, partial [Tulasnella sp. 427]
MSSTGFPCEPANPSTATSRELTAADGPGERTAAPTLAEAPIIDVDATPAAKHPPQPESIDIDLEKPPPNNKVFEDPAVEDAFPEGGRGWVVVFG